ncbi:hypothetical protein [Paenibacillus guangzhouensis]|uniref:hypothetical protein n=1 Tax=Paenibacillus guangzhouensis TaxID=1473112 RepID=UPI001266A201|nr:hypothetical protein [Paenibacillus guangzhouensis]
MLSSRAVAISQLVMGSFDPETRWRDPNLARLPSMPDPDRESIVLCMDELLFPFCGPDDVLYSRCKIDPALQTYLNGLGFSFRARYRFDLNDEEELLPEQDVFKRCMFRLALDQGANDGLADRELHAAALSPYAITADTAAYLQAAGRSHPLPDLETVVRVNSKIYSHRLLATIGEKRYGTETSSASEMEEVGTILLKDGPYLVKDPFGVSGKGNLLIDNATMQRRIADHLRKQEANGLRSHFLLEPLLSKEIDFSSHWFIRASGEIDFISVQRMMNHQQNYGGSIQAYETLIRVLEDAGYFGVMESALRLLSDDGYRGFVCFDSMLLKDGEVVPIVEINARKSMGLINAYVDKVWEQYDLAGWLTFLSIGLPEGFVFERLLRALSESGLLLAVPGGYGIMPLSSNTVMVNELLSRRRMAEGSQGRRGIPKGRLYVSVVGRDDEHRGELMRGLRQLLSDLSVRVYN